MSIIRLGLNKGIYFTLANVSIMFLWLSLNIKAEMEKLSKSLSKEQIDKVFARFDADGDGRLSYAEFRKMMNK